MCVWAGNDNSRRDHSKRRRESVNAVKKIMENRLNSERDAVVKRRGRRDSAWLRGKDRKKREGSGVMKGSRRKVNKETG